MAVDALANFNRDRQEDAVHARAEGPERENIERELGEVLPVGLVARSSRRLGRLRVKSGKSVDQSVLVRVARASFLPPHALSTRQSSSSITFACLGTPTRAIVRPRRRKSRPERIAALGSCDREPTPMTERARIPRNRRRCHRRVPTTTGAETTRGNNLRSIPAVLDRLHASRRRQPVDASLARIEPPSVDRDSSEPHRLRAVSSPRESRRRARDRAMRENDAFRTFSFLAMFASRVVHCRRRARAAATRGRVRNRCDTVCSCKTSPRASFGRHATLSLDSAE